MVVEVLAEDICVVLLVVIVMKMRGLDGVCENDGVVGMFRMTVALEVTKVVVVVMFSGSDEFGSCWALPLALPVACSLFPWSPRLPFPFYCPFCLSYPFPFLTSSL